MIESLENQTNEIRSKLEKTDVPPKTNLEYMMKMANYHHLTNQYDKAVQEYDEVLKADPDNKVAKKNKEITISKFSKIFSSEKAWKDKNVDLNLLADKIKSFLTDQQKMQVETLFNSERTKYEIRAHKKPKFRLVSSGMKLQVGIVGVSNNFVISINQQNTTSPVLASGVSYSISNFRFLKIRNSFWNFIEEQMNILVNSGT